MHAVRPCPSRSTTGETLGDRRRIRLRQVHPRAHAGGARSSPRPAHIEIEGTTAATTPTPRPSASSSSMSSRTRSSSLNPRKTIRQIMEAPLMHLHGMDRETRAARISRDLREPSICATSSSTATRTSSPAASASASASPARWPPTPQIIVLDEPVSALDVSVQAQVLNLLADLQRRVRPDLSVHQPRPGRGRGGQRPDHGDVFRSVVEIGPGRRAVPTPRHPYTKLLADSAPVVGRALTAPEQKDSELPDPLNPPPGCAFAGRCPRATERCLTAEPNLRPLGEHQLAACHHPLD